MKHLLAIPFALACLLGAVHAQAQAVTVSYDTFMKQDVIARRTQFQGLTADNKAALAREQVVRWQRANADRLTPGQNQLLAEVAAFIRPDFYESNLHDTATQTALRALEERVSKAFTNEQSLNFMTFDGPYLPQ